MVRISPNDPAMRDGFKEALVQVMKSKASLAGKIDTVSKIDALHKKFLETIIRAFGGCTKCYGKGYGTKTEFAEGGRKRWQLPKISFCSCERGKQLKTLFKEHGVQ